MRMMSASVLLVSVLLCSFCCSQATADDEDMYCFSPIRQKYPLSLSLSMKPYEKNGQSEIQKEYVVNYTLANEAAAVLCRL